MAIMSLSNRMVYWKIKMDGLIDITSYVGKNVSSIKIKTTTLPPKKNNTKPSAPTEATIDFTSKSYIEDWFTEGRKVDIYMGYDKLNPNIVFHGRIIQLPEGNAKDMINYSVKAFGEEMQMTMTKRNITFPNMHYKASIVYTVMANYDYISQVVISDENILTARSMPKQRDETDMEFLTRIAFEWNCVFWFEYPNYFYFVDAILSPVYKETPIYKLGYRTDKTTCNVEVVEWKHIPARAANEENSGSLAYNEDGSIKGYGEFAKHAPDEQGRWGIWDLKPELVERAKTDPTIFWSIAYIAKSYKWTTDAHDLLRRFYELKKYDDSINPNIPGDADSGFEITVHLNEGDPTLFPPQKAALWSGSLNPRADSSLLPRFLNRYSMNDYISLNINETNLSLENGRLRQDLKCSIGQFE